MSLYPWYNTGGSVYLKTCHVKWKPCYRVVICAHLDLHQVRPSLGSRRFACRRSFQSLWPISWSRTAAVSFPLWALWWSASKPSRLSYLRLSIRSKVQTHPRTESYGFKLDTCSSSSLLFCSGLCLSAAWGGGGHCRVQLEKKPPLQPHSLPGALPDMHGGTCLFVCVLFMPSMLMCVNMNLYLLCALLEL